jgi:transposase
MEPKGPPVQRRDALREQGALNPHAERVTDALFVGGGFFDSADLVQVKYEMLRHVRVDGRPVTEAAAGAGLSRPSYYEALAAFEENGVAGLVPHKRGPHGAHKLSTEVLVFIEQARAGTPRPTSAEVVRLVHERFGVTVHRRSIERARGREKKLK